jgi:hypothetical protein
MEGKTILLGSITSRQFVERLNLFIIEHENRRWNELAGRLLRLPFVLFLDVLALTSYFHYAPIVADRNTRSRSVFDRAETACGSQLGNC